MLSGEIALRNIHYDYLTQLLTLSLYTSLHTDFGFTDIALQLFSSYLTDRTQYLAINS